MSTTAEDIRPFSELVPWMLMYGEDDIVVNKDGGMIAFFEVMGVDIDAATSSEVNYCLNAFDHAYETFKDAPAVFSWIVHRKKALWYPAAEFPDPYSQFIDEQRKTQFLSGKNYINRHYLAITWESGVGLSGFSDRISLYIESGYSPVVAAARAATSFIRGNDAFNYSAQELADRADKFQTLISRFTERLSGLGVIRMQGNELRAFLRRCVNPASEQEGVVAMPFLDTHLPNAELKIERELLVFDEMLLVAGISLKEPPKITYQGIFDQLITIDGEVIFSQNFRFSSKKAVGKYLTSVRQYNDLLKYSPLTWLYLAFNQNADARANEARLEAAESAHMETSRVEMNDAYYGWYAAQVMAIGNSVDEVERVIAEVAGMMEVNNLTAIREKTHLLSAFAGGIPGMYATQKRWFMMEIMSLSDLTPIRTVDPGHRENSYLTEQRKKYSPALIVMNTEYKTPYYLNFHVGDLGHALIVGPSRSGKSSGMNIIIAQFRKYAPSRIIIFDKDRSCRIPTILMGGDHIDVAGNRNIKWNPLTMLGEPGAMEWLAGWIEGLITYRGYRYAADDVKDVWRSLQGLAAQDSAHWTLGHLHSILSPGLQNELDAWVGQGQLAHYFDNLEDTFSLSNFCCIEMGEILQKDHVARAFMDYAFFRIYKLLRENNTDNGIVPTLIYIEECWFMLENPYFEQKIRDWTKTFAKFAAQLVMATQSLEDLAQSKVFSSLRDNIQTRLYLPNTNAMSAQLFPLYADQFGLHEDQIAQIAAGTQKRDYFIQQPGVFRKAVMAIDRASLAIVRSDLLAQSIFQRHYDSGQANWKENYREEMSRVI
ncbi:MAG: VirB4 family type IV secretion system protein [Sulfuriferula sp.]